MASSSTRRRVDEVPFQQQLTMFAVVNNFSCLTGLKSVIEQNIDVSYTQYECSDKTIVSKAEYQQAIDDSDFVKKNSVPTDLIDIIVGLAYTMQKWQNELQSHLPQLPSDNGDSGELIQLKETNAYSMYSQWFRLNQMRRDISMRTKLDDSMFEMGTTLEHVVELLKANCWTAEMYYQNKTYDPKTTISMILTGIQRHNTGNTLHIFRLYVSRPSLVLDLTTF